MGSGGGWRSWGSWGDKEDKGAEEMERYLPIPK